MNHLPANSVQSIMSIPPLRANRRAPGPVRPPKWRRRLSACLLSLAALLLAACSSDPALALYLEANRGQLSQPAGAGSQPVEFVVEPGTPAKAIAQDLFEAGLIDDALLFEAYVRVNGLASQLEAGAYQLRPNMTPVEIAAALQDARARSITVAVREGWRLEETASYLDKLGALEGGAYRELASSADLSGFDLVGYDFLQFHPADASLEGYLYPDSYQLPAEGATAADLIQRQLDEFQQKVMPVYWEAVAQGATTLELHEVLTLASIVEREAVVDEERPIIAGVYLNRLARDMRLEADPTVQYALGYQPDSDKWWKSPMSLEEYGQVNSPYNTYLYPGLPPGPIAAAGLASIRAVLHPAQHDYLYFVAEPGRTGRHVFSRTFEEHLENVRRYRGE